MSEPEKNHELQSALRLNAALVATVEQQQQAINRLREELSLFKRKFFGKSSERHVDDESRLRLFELGEEEQVEVDPEPEGPPVPPRGRRRKKKSEKLPDHLRREVIEADVDEKDRICPCCCEGFLRDFQGHAVVDAYGVHFIGRFDSGFDVLSGVFRSSPSPRYLGLRGRLSSVSGRRVERLRIAAA